MPGTQGVIPRALTCDAYMPTSSVKPQEGAFEPTLPPPGKRAAGAGFGVELQGKDLLGEPMGPGFQAAGT